MLLSDLINLFQCGQALFHKLVLVPSTNQPYFNVPKLSHGKAGL